MNICQRHLAVQVFSKVTWLCRLDRRVDRRGVGFAGSSFGGLSTSVDGRFSSSSSEAFQLIGRRKVLFRIELLPLSNSTS